LIPYLLVAAFGLKLAWTGDTYEKDSRDRRKDVVIAVIATVYAALMIYAGGMKFILLSMLIYAPGTILFLIARREQKKAAFTARELILFGVIASAALFGVYALASGLIAI